MQLVSLAEYLFNETISMGSTHNAGKGNLRCTQVSRFFVCKLIHLAINLFHTRNEIPEGLGNYKSSTPSFFCYDFFKRFIHQYALLSKVPIRCYQTIR